LTQKKKGGTKNPQSRKKKRRNQVNGAQTSIQRGEKSFLELKKNTDCEEEYLYAFDLWP